MRLGDPHNRKAYASGGVDIAGSDFDRAIIEKRMLTHFGYGRVKYHPEIMDMVHAVSDWMALPNSVPHQQKHSGESHPCRCGSCPNQSITSLIYNDLAFTFYNAWKQARSPLSDER
jgi:hypothetical protein